MASNRMMLKIAQIARMRICGVKDVAIAPALNMSAGNLQRILRTPMYQEYEQALMHGHLSEMDKKMASNRALLWKMQQMAVPMAQRRILEVAMQHKDLKAALAASKEILDRDPDRTLVTQADEVKRMDPNAGGLPATLFDAIAQDADGVSLAVKGKLSNLDKTDA